MRAQRRRYQPDPTYNEAAASTARAGTEAAASTARAGASAWTRRTKEEDEKQPKMRTRTKEEDEKPKMRTMKQPKRMTRTKEEDEKPKMRTIKGSVGKWKAKRSRSRSRSCSQRGCKGAAAGAAAGAVKIKRRDLSAHTEPPAVKEEAKEEEAASTAKGRQPPSRSQRGGGLEAKRRGGKGRGGSLQAAAKEEAASTAKEEAKEENAKEEAPFLEADLAKDEAARVSDWRWQPDNNDLSHALVIAVRYQHGWFKDAGKRPVTIRDLSAHTECSNERVMEVIRMSTRSKRKGEEPYFSVRPRGNDIGNFEVATIEPFKKSHPTPPWRLKTPTRWEERWERWDAAEEEKQEDSSDSRVVPVEKIEEE